MTKKNILAQLNKNQNVVVICQGSDYTKKITNLYKEVSKKFKKICLVTIRKSSAALINEFEKQHINYSNYYFIDCLSVKSTKEPEQRLYISSPTALTELALAIQKVRSKHKVDLIILDNISSLLVYNQELMVLKFLHSIMTKIRKTNTKAIYPVLQESKKEFIADLSMFADAVIKA